MPTLRRPKKKSRFFSKSRLLPARRSPYSLEYMEPRFLLSGTPVHLGLKNGTVETHLSSTLQGLVNAGKQVNTQYNAALAAAATATPTGIFSPVAPLINQSLNSFLNGSSGHTVNPIGDFLFGSTANPGTAGSPFITALTSYFNTNGSTTDPNATSSANLAAALNSLVQTNFGSGSTVVDNSSTTANLLELDFTLSTTLFTQNVPINLGTAAQELGLAFDPNNSSLNLSVNEKVQFSLIADLNNVSASNFTLDFGSSAHPTNGMNVSVDAVYNNTNSTQIQNMPLQVGLLGMKEPVSIPGESGTVSEGAYISDGVLSFDIAAKVEFTNATPRAEISNPTQTSALIFNEPDLNPNPASLTDPNNQVALAGEISIDTPTGLTDDIAGIPMNQLTADLHYNVTNDQYLDAGNFIPNPGYISGLSGVSGDIYLNDANLLDGHAIVVASDATTPVFSRMGPQQLLNLLTNAQQWAQLYTSSSVFSNTPVPLLGEKLSDAYDFGSAFQTALIDELSYSQNIITGINMPSTNGSVTDFSGGVTFGLSLNGGASVAVSLAATTTAARPTIDALIADLNTALDTALGATAGTAARVQARKTTTNGRTVVEFYAANPNDTFAFAVNPDNTPAAGVLNLGLPTVNESYVSGTGDVLANTTLPSGTSPYQIPGVSITSGDINLADFSSATVFNLSVTHADGTVQTQAFTLAGGPFTSGDQVAAGLQYMLATGSLANPTPLYDPIAQTGVTVQAVTDANTGGTQLQFIGLSDVTSITLTDPGINGFSHLQISSGSYSTAPYLTFALSHVAANGTTVTDSPVTVYFNGNTTNGLIGAASGELSDLITALHNELQLGASPLLNDAAGTGIDVQQIGDTSGPLDSSGNPMNGRVIFYARNPDATPGSGGISSFAITGGTASLLAQFKISLSNSGGVSNQLVVSQSKTYERFTSIQQFASELAGSAYTDTQPTLTGLVAPVTINTDGTLSANSYTGALSFDISVQGEPAVQVSLAANNGRTQIGQLVTALNGALNTFLGGGSTAPVQVKSVTAGNGATVLQFYTTNSSQSFILTRINAASDLAALGYGSSKILNLGLSTHSLIENGGLTEIPGAATPTTPNLTVANTTGGITFQVAVTTTPSSGPVTLNTKTVTLASDLTRTTLGQLVTALNAALNTAFGGTSPVQVLASASKLQFFDNATTDSYVLSNFASNNTQTVLNLGLTAFDPANLTLLTYSSDGSRHVTGTAAPSTLNINPYGGALSFDLNYNGVPVPISIGYDNTRAGLAGLVSAINTALNTALNNGHTAPVQAEVITLPGNVQSIEFFDYSGLSFQVAVTTNGTTTTKTINIAANVNDTPSQLATIINTALNTAFGGTAAVQASVTGGILTFSDSANNSSFTLGNFAANNGLPIINLGLPGFNPFGLSTLGYLSDASKNIAGVSAPVMSSTLANTFFITRLNNAADLAARGLGSATLLNSTLPANPYTTIASPTFVNDSTKTFTFPLDFTYSPADQTGVAVDLSGSFDNLNTLTTAVTADVHRAMTSKFDFGVSLQPEADTTLYPLNQPAVAALPIDDLTWDGTLPYDATMKLTLDDGSAYTISIAASATSANTSPQDFVTNNLIPALHALSLQGNPTVKMDQVIQASVVTDPSTGYSVIQLQTNPTYTRSRMLLITVPDNVASDVPVANSAASFLGFTGSPANSTVTNVIFPASGSATPVPNLEGLLGTVSFPATGGNFVLSSTGGDVILNFTLPLPDGGSGSVDIAPGDTSSNASILDLVNSIQADILATPGLVGYASPAAGVPEIPTAKILVGYTTDASNNSKLVFSLNPVFFPNAGTSQHLTLAIPPSYVVPQPNGFTNVDIGFPSSTVGSSLSTGEDLQVVSGIISNPTITAGNPAVFDISVAGSAYFQISVSNTTDINSLVQAINTAFSQTTVNIRTAGNATSSANLGTMLQASLYNGTDQIAIRLLAPNTPGATSFRFSADAVANNAAVSQLGFSTTEQFLRQTLVAPILSHISLEGDATVVGTSGSFDVAGNLGYIAFSSTGGNLYVNADTTVNPQGTGGTTSFFLVDLLNDVLASPDISVANLATNSSSFAEFTLNNIVFLPDAYSGQAISGLSMPAGASATVTFTPITDINNLPVANVTYSHTNGMEALGTLSFDDIYNALMSSAQYLSDQMNLSTGPFSANLPFIKQRSISSIFNFGDNFQGLVDNAGLTAPLTLQQLVGGMQASLGLQPGALGIKFITTTSNGQLTNATFYLSLDYQSDIKQFTLDLPLYLDINQLGGATGELGLIQQDLNHLAALTVVNPSEGEATVEVTGSGVLHLDFGINLVLNGNQQIKPVPFLDPSTTFKELVNLGGSNMTADIPFDGVVLQLSNGQVAMNATGQAAGLDAHGIQSVYDTDGMLAVPQLTAKVATDSNLSATYVDKSSTNANEIGSELVATANGVFSAQSVTGFAVGDLVLVNGQTTASQNGVYEILNLGSSTSKWVLSRVQLSPSTVSTTAANATATFNNAVTLASEVTALNQLRVTISSGTYQGQTLETFSNVTTIGASGSSIFFASPNRTVKLVTDANLAGTYIDTIVGGLNSTDIGSVFLYKDIGTYTDFNIPGLEGVTNLAVGDIIILDAQTDAAQNGVYQVTSLGSDANVATSSPGSQFTLTRVALSPSANTSPTMADEIKSLNTVRYNVQSGEYAGDTFQQISQVTAIGSTDITFAQQILPSTFSINLNASSGTPDSYILPYSVYLATTAALPAATYSLGNPGVTEPSLTAKANSGGGYTPLNQIVNSDSTAGIDGNTMMQVGDLILVKNQPANDGNGNNLVYENGVYEVTSVGSATTPWKLTRVPWADSANKLKNLRLSVLDGATNYNTRFIGITTVNDNGYVSAGQSITFSSDVATVYAGWTTQPVVGKATANMPINIQTTTGGTASLPQVTVTPFVPVTIDIENIAPFLAGVNTPEPVVFTSLPDWGSLHTTNPLDLIRDGLVVGDDLDLALFSLQTSLDQALGNLYPVIGGNLPDYVTFIEDFRSQLTNAIRSDIAADPLTPVFELQSAIYQVLGPNGFGYLTSRDDITIQALDSSGAVIPAWSFNNVNNSANYAVNLDQNPGATIDNTTVDVTQSNTVFEVVPSTARALQFSLNITHVFDTVATAVAIPEINLEDPGLGLVINSQTGPTAPDGGVPVAGSGGTVVNGGLLLERSFSLPLTFGFDTTDGFYLQRQGYDSNGNRISDITVDVAAYFDGNIAANGTTGAHNETPFYQGAEYSTWNSFTVAAFDQQDTPGTSTIAGFTPDAVDGYLPSGFYGQFNLYFNPGSGVVNNRIVISDLQDKFPLGATPSSHTDPNSTGLMDLTLNADADVHLSFQADNSTIPQLQGDFYESVRYGSGALLFPTISAADITAGVTTTSSGVDEPAWRFDRSQVANGATRAGLMDLTLDAAGYQGQVLTALRKFYDGYAPIKPYVDFVTTPLPGISSFLKTPIILSDLAGSLGGAKGAVVAALLKIFQAFTQGVSDTINGTITPSYYGPGTPPWERPRTKIGNISDVGLVVRDPFNRYDKFGDAFGASTRPRSNTVVQEDATRSRSNAVVPTDTASNSSSNKAAAQDFTQALSAITAQPSYTSRFINAASSALSSAGTSIANNAVALKNYVAAGVSSAATKAYNSAKNYYKNKLDSKGKTTPVIGITGGAFRYDLLFPNNVMALLVGQEANTLFIEAPRLEVGVSYSKYFPIPAFPIVGGTLNITFSVFASFNFGWDNHGFYFSTVNSHGVPTPAFGFYAQVALGVELNIGVVEAGVQVFLGVGVNFNWNVDSGATKLHQSQIDYIDTHGLSLFQVSITITIGITFYVDIDFILFSSRILSITFSYSHTFDLPISRPTAQLGTVANGVLYLNMGYENATYNSTARLFGNLDPLSEDFVVKDHGSGVEVDATIGSDVYQQFFSGVSLVIGYAGHGTSVIDASHLTNAVVNFYGGDGNSILIAGAGVANSVSRTFGANPSVVNGRNFLEGGTGTSTLVGGTSANYIIGGKHNTTLDDRASTSSSDVLMVGSGDDILYGAAGGSDFVFLNGFGRDRIYEQGFNNTVDMSNVTSSLNFSLGQIVDSVSQGSSYVFLTPTSTAGISTWYGGSGGDLITISYFPPNGTGQHLTFHGGTGTNFYKVYTGRPDAIYSANATANIGHIDVIDANPRHASTMLVQTTRANPITFSQTAVGNGREQLTMSGLGQVSLDAGNNVVYIGSPTSLWQDLGHDNTIKGGTLVLLGNVEVDNTTFIANNDFVINHDINIRDNGYLNIDLQSPDPTGAANLVLGNVAKSGVTLNDPNGVPSASAVPHIYSSAKSQIYDVTVPQNTTVTYITLYFNFFFFTETISIPIYTVTTGAPIYPPLGDGTGTLTVYLPTGSIENYDQTHYALIQVNTFFFDVSRNVGSAGQDIQLDTPNIAGEVTGTGNVFLYSYGDLNILQSNNLATPDANVTIMPDGLSVANGDIHVEVASGHQLTVGALSATGSLGAGGNIYLLADKINFTTTRQSTHQVLHTLTISWVSYLEQFGFSPSFATYYANLIDPGHVGLAFYYYVTEPYTLTGQTTISGTGSLFLANETDRMNINVGDPTVPLSNALNITSADLSAIRTGFASVVIGRDYSATNPITGNVRLGDPAITGTALSLNFGMVINGTNIDVAGNGLGLKLNEALQLTTYMDPQQVASSTNGDITIDAVNGGDVINAPTVLFQAAGDLVVNRAITIQNLNGTGPDGGKVELLAGTNTNVANGLAIHTGSVTLNSTIDAAIGSDNAVDIEAGSTSGNLTYTPTTAIDATGSLTLYALGGTLNFGTALIIGDSLDVEALHGFTLNTEINELVLAQAGKSGNSFVANIGITINNQINTGDSRTPANRYGSTTPALQVDAMTDTGTGGNIVITTKGEGIAIGQINAGGNNVTVEAPALSTDVGGNIFEAAPGSLPPALATLFGNAPLITPNIYANQLTLKAQGSISLVTDVNSITAFATPLGTTIGDIDITSTAALVTLSDVETSNGSINVGTIQADQAITATKVISQKNSSTDTITLITADLLTSGPNIGTYVGTAATLGKGDIIVGTVNAGDQSSVSITSSGRILTDGSTGLITANTLNAFVYGTATGTALDHADIIDIHTRVNQISANNQNGDGDYNINETGSTELEDVTTSNGNITVTANNNIVVDVLTSGGGKNVSLAAGTQSGSTLLTSGQISMGTAVINNGLGVVADQIIAHALDVTAAYQATILAPNAISLVTTVANDITAQATYQGDITIHQSAGVTYDYVAATDGNINLTTGVYNSATQIITTPGDAKYGVIDASGNINLTTYGTEMMAAAASIVVPNVANPVPKITGQDLTLLAYGTITLATDVAQIDSTDNAAGNTTITQDTAVLLNSMVSNVVAINSVLGGNVDVTADGTITVNSVAAYGLGSSISLEATVGDIVLNTLAASLVSPFLTPPNLNAVDHITLTSDLGKIDSQTSILTTGLSQIVTNTLIAQAKTGLRAATQVQHLQADVLGAGDLSVYQNAVPAPLDPSVVYTVDYATTANGSIYLESGSRMNAMHVQSYTDATLNPITLVVDSGDLVLDAVWEGTFTNPIDPVAALTALGHVWETTFPLQGLPDLTSHATYGDITLQAANGTIQHNVPQDYALNIIGNNLTILAQHSIGRADDVAPLGGALQTSVNTITADVTGPLAQNTAFEGIYIDQAHAVELKHIADQDGPIQIKSNGTITVDSVAAYGAGNFIDLDATSGDILLSTLPNALTTPFLPPPNLYAPDYVKLHADQGKIDTQTDPISTAVSQILTQTLMAQAKTGIRAATQVQHLQADVFGTGNMTIYQNATPDPLDPSVTFSIDYATTQNGSIFIDSANTTTAYHIQSYTDATGNPIILKVDSGNLTLDAIWEGTFANPITDAAGAVDTVWQSTFPSAGLPDANSRAYYGDVTINVPQGWIQSIPTDYAQNIIAANLTMLAEYNIGRLDSALPLNGSIHIAANTVTADSTGPANPGSELDGIYLDSTHEVELTHVVANNGPIVINSTGTITADVVETILDDLGDTITMNTTNGANILVGLVVAGFDGYTGLSIAPEFADVILNSDGNVNGLPAPYPLPNNANIGANNLFINAQTGIGNIIPLLTTVRNSVWHTVGGDVNSTNSSSHDVIFPITTTSNGNIHYIQTGGGDLYVPSITTLTGNIFIDVKDNAAIYVISTFSGGNTTFIADKIEFIGGSDTIRGYGFLTLEPDNPLETVMIQSPDESSPPNTLNQLDIGQRDLHAIGFQYVFIGNPFNPKLNGVVYIYDPDIYGDYGSTIYNEFRTYHTVTVANPEFDGIEVSAKSFTDLKGAHEILITDSAGKLLIDIEDGEGFDISDFDGSPDALASVPTQTMHQDRAFVRAGAARQHAVLTTAKSDLHFTQPKASPVSHVRWSDQFHTSSLVIVPLLMFSGSVTRISNWVRRRR